MNYTLYSFAILNTNVFNCLVWANDIKCKYKKLASAYDKINVGPGKLVKYHNVDKY